MAFDGIVTRAMVTELRGEILHGRIDRIYQPAKDELAISLHTAKGTRWLFCSSSSMGPRVSLIDRNPPNPPVPLPFCMLLRKHLAGGRILSIEQKDAERIIEISVETVSELGFSLSKKLIIEIMGRHSNIVLVDAQKGNIIDSIKHVSIDTSRVRQVLPGKAYEYPPPQDKTGFDMISEAKLGALPADPRVILGAVGGISPAVAAELARSKDRYARLRSMISESQGNFTARIYRTADGASIDYHITDLSEYEESCLRSDFPSLSACLNEYFESREQTNRAFQLSHDLVRHLNALIEKAELKEQRLSEDLMRAENSDDLRLCGELLTANLHLAKPGAKEVRVINYYDGSELSIPLDPRRSAAWNAQHYFRRYSKARKAIREIGVQLEETRNDILYLGSVLESARELRSPEDIETIRQELISSGFMRRRSGRDPGRGRTFKAKPLRYTAPSGAEILVGRNNRENDELTLRTAEKTDYWFHTKDIPGSHVILRTGGAEPAEADIFCAAGIAAWHSKARSSGNVPVDYVRVRFVKKPSGARPGMVVFTNNRTVYVDPLDADKDSK